MVDPAARWCSTRRARGLGAAARSSSASPSRRGPGMLLLRVAACGVCRTDLQLCEGDLAMHALPIVPGHQIVGRVEAVGAGVDGLARRRSRRRRLAGRRLRRLRQVPLGRENLCARATFTGWDVDGGYATHAAVRADFALRLPDGFDDLAAAPLLCGGVIGYRSLKRSGIAPGGRLGLYGFGASALIALQIARHWGCRVFVARARTPSGSGRSRSAPSGRAATTTRRPSRSMPR